MRRFLFTSESVSEGHPDKVADRISDEVLDAALRRDVRARVAVESLVTRDLCVVAGEVTLAERLDYEGIARAAIRDIGYSGGTFDPDEVAVLVKVHKQSPEIGVAVTQNEGAGDQGIMFGYACRETDTLMPAPIHYAHRIVEALARARHAGDRRLGPDAKSQVTLEYADGRPVRAATVVVSHQHPDEVTQEELRTVIEPVVRSVLPDGWFDAATQLFVNPSGSFAVGGPSADTGVTGRKIVVDTYGGAAPHGGGAFSGKDPTKVDRSATYAARYLAKNVVAAGIADRCLIQLAYAIGRPEPLAVYVDTQGTSHADPERIAKAVSGAMDLTPRGLREHLGLAQPIYARTSAYGHFGRAPEADGGFSWERTDLAEKLAKAI